MSLAIDNNNNLLRVDEPENASIAYSYDANHRILMKTDSRGNTSKYTYGEKGNLVQAEQANGEICRFDSGRARIAYSSSTTSSNSAPLASSTAQAEDSYVDGNGSANSRVTNRYGSATRRTDASGNSTYFGRNSANKVTQITYPNGATETLTYNSKNQITSRVHSAGLTSEYLYDNLNRLIAISGNRSVNQFFVYDDNYNITKISSGRGALVSGFTYNEFGLPLTSTIDNKTTQYDYDTNGQLIRTTNANNEQTEYEYDSAGNRTLVRDTLGRETRYVYDQQSRLTSITDAQGNITRFGYQAVCGTQRHLLMSVTDAKGNTTSYDYDELGQRISETDAAGNVTTYTYNGNRKLESVTYPNGNTVGFVYDLNDRLSKKNANGEITEFSYDVMGNMLTATDTDSTIQNTYDLANRRTRIVTGGSAQSPAELAQTYNGVNRDTLTATSGAVTKDYIYNYDTMHRLLRIGSDGNDYTFFYDQQGRRSTLRYGQSNSSPEVDYQYDNVSRLLGIAGTGFPGEIGYSYDTVGRRTAYSKTLTSPPSLSLALDNDPVTTDTLTITGQVVNAGDSVGGSVTANGQAITLNADGSVSGQAPLSLGFNWIEVAYTDAAGQTISVSIRVERIQDTTTSNYNFEELLAATSTGLLYAREPGTAGDFPGAGAPIAEANAFTGEVTYPIWLSFATDVDVDTQDNVYNLQGSNLMRYSGGINTIVGDLSSLLSVDDMEVGFGDQAFVTSGSTIYRIEGGLPVLFATLPGNNIRLEATESLMVAGSLGSGVFYQVQQDGTYSPVTQTGPVYTGTDFALGADGTLCYAGAGWVCLGLIDTSVSYAPGSMYWTSAEFAMDGALYLGAVDNLYRWDGTDAVALLSAPTTGTDIAGTVTVSVQSTYTQSADSYTYDGIDQLTDVIRNTQASEQYAYDALGNRTTSTTASDYSHNTLNQTLSGEGASYTYDANGNRLTKTDGAGTTVYDWDGENRLTGIVFPDGAKDAYAYDPFGRRIQVQHIDPVGQVTTRRYVYDGEDIVFMLDGNDTVLTSYTHGPGIDEPLAVTQGGSTYRYHSDALGSPIALTDTQGNIVQRYEYDSWGVITTPQDGSIDQPYGFTGREYDTTSGLYFYRARYYDPELGRFLNRDPIGLGGGDVNFYRYVWNIPTIFTDSSGLNPFLGNPYLGGFVGGVGDFLSNYYDMRQANTIGADKYFHCMANCEASRRGPGGVDAAELISEGRELYDENVKGDTPLQCEADRAANDQGRNSDPNIPCPEACNSLRPGGL